MTIEELREAMERRNRELIASGANFRLSHREGRWEVVCAGCGEEPHDPMCAPPTRAS